MALIAAILILAVGAWQVKHTHDVVLTSAEQDAQNLARTLSQHAGRMMEAVDLLLSGTVEQAGENLDHDQLTAFLMRRALRATEVRSLVVTDRQGKWIADTWPEHNPMDSADTAGFKWARDHDDGDLFIGDLTEKGFDGRPALPLSRRLNNPDGSFGGIVVASLAPEFLHQFYSAVRIGANGTVALYNVNGHLLVRYPLVAETGRIDPVRSENAARMFKAQSGAVRSFSPLDGIERIFAFEHVAGYPLVVSVAVGVNDALTAWRRESVVQAVVRSVVASVLIMLGFVMERHRRRAVAAEAATLEINRKYRLLAENSSDLIALKPSFLGVRSYVSPSSRTLVGWEPEELAELATEKFIHPDDFERVADDFAKLSPEMPCVTSLHRVRHKAGHFVWFETVFQLTGAGTQQQSVVVAARDVTARQHMEEALKESEGRYRILADESSDIITRLDLDFRTQYISPACLTVFGYAPFEMLGVRLLESIHPDDLAAVEALATRLGAGEIEGDRAVATYRALHKQGHWVWLESGMNLVRDALSGAPASLICSLRDVTERQRAAQLLERAKAAAEQATLAKAEFLANMSHELRTPLAGMLGVHDLLRSDPALNEAQRRLVGLASESGRSLLIIVNDILDLSKIDAGQLSIEKVPFDLRNVIERCQGLAGEALKGKPVRIEANFSPPEPGWFVGDPTRLQQILLNMLMNAVKFTERGTIAIQAVYSEVSATLRVEVTDTGIGIPADKLPTLFERFSQADASITRRYGGTGLGLAICTRLVELMDGRIGVESEADRGSRFWFELPLMPHSGATEAAPLASPDQGRKVALRILLAEDNTINREVISAMLIRHEHVVTAVSDGLACVEAVKVGSKFDLILMDLQMPRMDGLSATAAIRRIEEAEGRSRTPIVGLTANAMAGDVESCLQAGMDGHVAKPIDWANLIAVIDRVTTESVEGPFFGKPAGTDRGDVLSGTTLEMLERMIGRERLAKLLNAFGIEVENRIAALDAVDAKALSSHMHVLKSSAGQLGFLELSRVCAEIEMEARHGGGLQRISELRDTAARAMAAARASLFAEAA